MKFAFTTEQRLFAETVADLLAQECPPEAVRAAWHADRAWSRGRWAAIAALGVPAVLVPEHQGGLGLDDVDLVLLAEEAGRAALPEPLVETAGVAAPLLAELVEAGDRDAPAAREWLGRVVAGEALVAVGRADDRYVVGALEADLIIVLRGTDADVVTAGGLAARPQPSVDRSRRLAAVDGDSPVLVTGPAGRATLRAVLGTAAQLIGITRHLIDTTVAYAVEREQFGQPIGGFQAVKHHLANARLALEFARPAVYRAAWSVAHDTTTSGRDVSMAKALASDAAEDAARVALQVHGAIGYTFEHDLHLWLKRAWALAAAWGSAAEHRRRVGDAVLA